LTVLSVNFGRNGFIKSTHRPKLFVKTYFVRFHKVNKFLKIDSRNAEKFPELVATLRGHTGLVKGVVFDPVGKFLASQSDDKTMRIWRTSDWSQEAVIEKPFIESGGTTPVLRCRRARAGVSWINSGCFVVVGGVT
jgi:WD40 repeat protein